MLLWKNDRREDTVAVSVKVVVPLLDTVCCKQEDMEKTIKKSKRGLTFSFDETETFYPGAHYVYDIKGNKIIIAPSKQGNTVSRKKSGKKVKSLLDIRRREVVAKVQQSDYMDISITEDKIIVTLCKKAKVLPFVPIETYIIPKTLLMASGFGQQIGQWVDKTYGAGTVSEHRIPKRDIKAPITVISLFSGAGMLDYPFYQDDAFEIILACDCNKAATETYRHNIGNHIIHGDIRDLTDVGSADVVIGGPSCKPFSNANRHTRMLKHDDFFLYREYIRVVKESKPKMFVMENVPQSITAEGGVLAKEVASELSDYDITTNLVCDAEVGGFTMRKRVFLIGSRIGKAVLPSLCLATKRTVREALTKVDETWFNYHDISTSSEDTKKKMSYVKDGGNFRDIPVSMRDRGLHSNHYRRLSMDGLCPTLTNFRKVCLMPPREIATDRILSVAEASALSGLDKGFSFLGSISERQQQVGNGVPYKMARMIKNAVKNQFCKPQTVYSIG